MQMLLEKVVKRRNRKKDHIRVSLFCMCEKTYALLLLFSFPVVSDAL